MLPDWKIYYSDGSTFVGDVLEAPSFDVQVILYREGRFNRRVLKTSDFYLWRPSLNKWTEHTDSTSAIIASLKEPWVKLLCGQYLREEEFEKILIRAHNDPDFTPTVADPPHEAWRK